LEREATSAQESTDESYQKKIMPWEMMLHSDIDLTKSLVQHHVRPFLGANIHGYANQTRLRLF
jgi:GTP cyclohydrolase I